MRVQLRFACAMRLATRCWYVDTERHLFAAAQGIRPEDHQGSSGVIARINDAVKAWRKAGDALVIIDGGGNVGYASVYFANRYNTTS